MIAGYVLTCCLVVIALADEPAVPKQLIGVWRLDSTSSNGSPPTKPGGPNWLVVFDNGEFVMKGPKSMWGGTVAVDTNVMPASIDFRITQRAGTGPERFTNLGLYEVKEGVLTVARMPEGKGRPTALAKGPEVILQVFGHARQ